MEPEKICENCILWNKSGYDDGECRKRAPITPLIVTTMPDTMYTGTPQRQWPRTNNTDWCGEWEQAEVDKDGNRIRR